MRALLAIAILLVSLSSCDDSLSTFGPGLHLQLRLPEGQLQRGVLRIDSGGPMVSQVLRPQAEVVRGDSSVILRGRLGPGGVALHVQAMGDSDHWVLPAKGFDFVVDDELQFSAKLEFSHAISVDQLVVKLQASDKNGRLGPVRETSFVMAQVVPPSRLLVSLAWDAPVDLDLYLRDSQGVIVGSKNINSYEAPGGQLPPPDAWMQGGFLDYDSNQHCDLDLRNRENILWLAADPPPGHYEVYAHLFSPCGQAAVNMIGTAHLGDSLLGIGGATQYEFDSREHPASGEVPGLLLLEFDVP